jgi:hypothetical protein
LLAILNAHELAALNICLGAFSQENGQYHQKTNISVVVSGMKKLVPLSHLKNGSGRTGLANPREPNPVQ